MGKERILISLLVCSMFSLSAYGQDFSKFEIYGAYSLMRATNPEDSMDLVPTDTVTVGISADEDRYLYMNGFKTGIAFNFNQYFGIVGEFGLNRSKCSFFQTSFEGPPSYPYYDWTVESATLQQADYSRNRYTLLMGPRMSTNLLKRFRPFAQILIGLDRNSTRAHQSYDVLQSGYGGLATRHFEATVLANKKIDDSFAVAIGGGLDLRIKKLVSIRLVEVEVVNSRETQRSYTARAVGSNSEGSPPSITSFDESDTAFGSPDHNLMNHLRFSFGVVFHLGEK